MKDLRGRLEAVSVVGKRFAADIFHGMLARTGESVLVRNGYMCPEKACLARFSSNPNEEAVCNFITSNIPDNFHGLSPEDYVVCGLWGNLPKQSRIPSFEEISAYFDAGNTSSILYFAERSGNHHGRYFVNSSLVHEMRRFGYRDIIRNTKLAEKGNSRLIILESEGELTKLENAFLMHSNLNLILMQSLIP